MTIFMVMKEDGDSATICLVTRLYVTVRLVEFTVS